MCIIPFTYMLELIGQILKCLHKTVSFLLSELTAEVWDGNEWIKINFSLQIFPWDFFSLSLPFLPYCCAFSVSPVFSIDFFLIGFLHCSFWSPFFPDLMNFFLSHNIFCLFLLLQTIKREDHRCHKKGYRSFT